MKSKRGFINLAFAIGFMFMMLFFWHCQDAERPSDQRTDASALNQRPAWFGERPIIFVGNWDSAPILQRRWGRASVDYEATYRRMHTEETVRKMKEQGITLVVTHFYKGFGLEAEWEYIEDTIKFAELCHKYGIKVGVYIGDTICYETFLKERPDAESWLVPDYFGAPVIYGGTQTFRRRPYIGHPDFVDYIKKVVRVAIEQVHADLIHFDNACSQALRENFQHPLAIEQFREFLREKHNASQLELRFGFSDVSYIVPPKYKGTPQPMIDPLFQEWTDFRCQKLSDHYRHLRKYIKSLNPDVVVEHNPHGVTGHNTAWLRGIDWPRTIASTKAFWSEGERAPGLRENGVLVSKIRSYKVGRIMDNVCFTVTGTDRLRMAEAMAFNQNCLGYVGGVLSVYNFPEDRTRYIKFFTDHFEHYRNTETIADVAILRTFPTMAYSSYRTQYSTILFEQTLIQEKIPFDIIFEHNLNDLSKYSVLVLANQECLSDEQVKQVREFVQSGGGLVMTENTSLYTEWMRRRPAAGLGAFLGTERLPATKQIRKEYGQGRVVYIPAIVPDLELPKNAATTSEYWKMPQNAGELVEAVRWAADGNVTFEVSAPPFVTAEFLQQTDTRKILVHLVNYNYQRTPLIKNIKVTFYGKVTKILMLSPDGASEQELDFKTMGDKISFVVPQLNVYDLIVMLP